MISLIIHGETGRLGKRVIENIKKFDNIKYVGYINRLYDLTILRLNKNIVILDVSSDIGCKNLLENLIKQNFYFPLVIGSTGNLPTELIKQYSERVQVSQVSNFCEGINKITKILKSLTLPNSNILIEETHHVLKKDAPSGTAKTLADIIDIPYDNIKSIREGLQYGLHTITIYNDYEKITISHETLDPNVFAIGCLKVIENIIDKPKGLNKSI
jgi:4-hydroxy-tetrahydrodipicolinate reductase